MESSRFKLLDKPPLYPFYDVVNQAPEGPVFDLGVDLEFYSGPIYIRRDHLEEMARSLGMLTKEEADSLREENQRLLDNNKKLPKAIKELRDGINDLVDAFSSGDTDNGPGSVSDSETYDSDSSESGKGERETSQDAGQANGNSFIEGLDSVYADSEHEPKYYDIS